MPAAHSEQIPWLSFQYVLPALASLHATHADVPFDKGVAVGHDAHDKVAKLKISPGTHSTHETEILEFAYVPSSQLAQTRSVAFQ